MAKRLRSWIVPLIVPVLFVCLWAYFSAKIGNRVILPSPQSVLQNFMRAGQDFVGLGSLPANIFVSLVRVVLGYLGGATLAVLVGLVMGYKPLADRMLAMFINLFRPIPSLAWVPLVLGWFGISSLATLLKVPRGPMFTYMNNFKLSMIFIIALGTFYPVITNVIFGVKNVPLTLLDSARVLGAEEKHIFTKILLPASAPTIINGLRVGLGTAWACLISAEMLPGSVSGLGYLITHSYELARTDLVVTGIICIGVIGALLDGVFRFLEVRYFAWGNRMK